MPQAKSQPEDLNSQNVKVSYGTASLPLTASYSSSRSSVRIQPVRAVPACGDVQQVTVHYHILATELGHRAARAHFYHLVSAGSASEVSYEPSLCQHRALCSLRNVEQRHSQPFVLFITL